MASYFDTVPFAPSLGFTPYQLDNNQVLNTINARTSYFLDGAMKIKNSYDNTFDFDISNENNINSLASQREQADKDLKGVIQSDLSIGDNRKRALDIFKGVATNQNYLYDEHITKQIKSGIGQAQESLKKNGADYYNSLSVQAMQNTLNKWRTDDPANATVYLDDTLGTTYQPYDPKIDQTFLKTLQTRVKDGKFKVDHLDGQGHILTTEYKDMNSLEAKEYINSIRPQQMDVQEALRARVDLDALSDMQKTPEGQKQILSHFQGLKEFNQKTEVGYLNNEKNKLLQEKAWLPSTDKTTADAYDAQIQAIDKNIADVNSKYSSFDDNAYIDPLKTKQARNQISSLYKEQRINGIVSGLGLGNTSTTIKQDAAYFSQRNLDLNERKFQFEQQYKAAQLALKAPTSQLNANGSNPTAFDTPDISNPDVILTEDDKVKVGGDRLIKIVGEPEAIKTESIKETLNALQLNVRNPNGYGTTDLLTAVEEAAKVISPGGDLSLFKDVSSKFTDERSKKLIEALITEGAFLEQGGHPSNMDKIRNVQASRWIKLALGNSETFQKAITKAGVDGQSFGYNPDGTEVTGLQLANKIYYKNQKAAQLTESNVTNFGGIIDAAARANGMNDFDEMKGDRQENKFLYKGDNFVYARKDQLKKQLNDKQIDALAKYVAGGKEITKEQILNENPSLGYVEERIQGLTGKTLYYTHFKPELEPLFDAMKGKWDKFDKDVKLGLAERGADFNNKAVLYNLYSTRDKTDKAFSSVEDFKDIDLEKILTQNQVDGSLLSNVEGVTNNKNFTEALSIFQKNGGISPEFLQTIKVESDGTKAWLTILPKALSDESKKKFADKIDIGGILDNNYESDDFFKDLGNVKIPIPLSVAQKDFHLPILSGAGGQLKAGKVYGVPKLMSGNTIHLSDRGNGENLNLFIDGGFKGIRISQAGKIEIKDVKFVPGNISEVQDFTGIGGQKNPQGFLQAMQIDPDLQLEFLSFRDLQAVTAERILKKYNINTTGQIDFTSLPQAAKDELKRTVPNLFGK